MALFHALNNHGAYVYLSDTESTVLLFSRTCFLSARLAHLHFFPKTLLAPPERRDGLPIFMSQRKIWIIPLVD